MDKQELLLAAKLLEMASDQYSNHGCNDLDSEITSLVTDENKLLNGMRVWNGDNDWPVSLEGVGDYSLMGYLSDLLRRESCPSATPKFGDYVWIEQVSHGSENEMYQYKVIGMLKSNSYVDIPVSHPESETWHPESEQVVACVCCGVSERHIYKYKLEDIRFTSEDKPKENDNTTKT